MQLSMVMRKRHLTHSTAILICALVAATAQARTFHVDAANGSDAATGSADAPWQTIQHGASQLLPGDVLEVRAGLYREAVSLSVSGADGAPVVIRCAPGVVLESPDPAASLSAFDVTVGTEHVELSGFAARGYHEAVFVRPGARRIVVRDCSLHDNRAGLWIVGASEIEVDGCEIFANASSGVRVSGASEDVVVRDTTSRGNHDGFGCFGDADGFTVEEPARAVAFEGCVARDNGEDGFDVQGDGVEIVASRSEDNGCAGVKLAGDAAIHASLVVGNRTGLAATSRPTAGQRVAVYNTIVADNEGTQILLRSPDPDEHPPYEVVLRNVVASGDGKSLEVGAGVSLVEDHNIFFRPSTTDGLIVIHRSDAAPLRYSGQEINAGLWAAESQGGESTWAIDPMFAPGDDYHCATSSPMIDSGSAAGAMDRDLVGTARPLGGAVDRGAYEFPAALNNQLPWPDPGPDREVPLGARLTFHSYGSFDPDGDALSFEWHFADDGSRASGDSATHTFLLAGRHTVSLTASDGTSERTRSAVVSVIDAVPTPTPLPDVCPARPPVGCAQATRNVLKFRDKRPSGPSSRDRLVWKWLGGPRMERSEWGAPLEGDTTYRVCVYDGSELLTELVVPRPGSVCERRPCWKSNRRGVKFRDRNADGVKVLKLIASTRRPRSKIIMVARGPDAFVDASGELVVQLQRSDAATACWQSTVAAR